LFSQNEQLGNKFKLQKIVFCILLSICFLGVLSINYYEYNIKKTDNIIIDSLIAKMDILSQNINDKISDSAIAYTVAILWRHDSCGSLYFKRKLAFIVSDIAEGMQYSSVYNLLGDPDYFIPNEDGCFIAGYNIHSYIFVEGVAKCSDQKVKKEDYTTWLDLYINCKGVIVISIICT